MEHAVDRRLHPAGPARLERPARRVEPNIATLHQKMRDMHVIVFDEGNSSAKAWIDGALVEALQMALAGLVRRMRLAGKYDLDGPSQREKDAGQSLGIMEDKIGPLVI